jgi:hypothetical protein
MRLGVLWPPYAARSDNSCYASPRKVLEQRCEAVGPCLDVHREPAARVRLGSEGDADARALE